MGILGDNVILEAFSSYLQSSNPQVPASWLLARWLWERLNSPAKSQIDEVLHCEIVISNIKEPECIELLAGKDRPVYYFKGKSSSGKRLLNSLWQYALSYEQQKWTRWVHTIKASDFNEKSIGLE